MRYRNVNETRDVDGYTVHKYRIVGTACVEYVALEPGDWSTHRTMHSVDDGRRLGAVTARALPAALASMPPGEARAYSVREWYGGVYAEAYAAILRAFPEAADGTRCMGGVSGTDYSPG